VERRVLALGEASLARPAVQQAPPVLSIPSADSQVAEPALAVIETLRILTGETAQVVIQCGRPRQGKKSVAGHQKVL
jgi:hypothetical protein